MINPHKQAGKDLEHVAEKMESWPKDTDFVYVNAGTIHMVKGGCFTAVNYISREQWAAAKTLHQYWFPEKQPKPEGCCDVCGDTHCVHELYPGICAEYDGGMVSLDLAKAIYNGDFRHENAEDSMNKTSDLVHRSIICPEHGLQDGLTFCPDCLADQASAKEDELSWRDQIDTCDQVVDFRPENGLDIDADIEIQKVAEKVSQWDDEYTHCYWMKWMPFKDSLYRYEWPRFNNGQGCSKAEWRAARDEIENPSSAKAEKPCMKTQVKQLQAAEDEILASEIGVVESFLGSPFSTPEEDEAWREAEKKINHVWKSVLANAPGKEKVNLCPSCGGVSVSTHGKDCEKDEWIDEVLTPEIKKIQDCINRLMKVEKVR